MFTAQVDEEGPMGMNHPEARQNAQFVLNVLHWLTGVAGTLVRPKPSKHVVAQFNC